MLQPDYNFFCHINSGGLLSFKITTSEQVEDIMDRLEIGGEIQTEDEASDRCDMEKGTNLNQPTVHLVVEYVTWK